MTATETSSISPSPSSSIVSTPQRVAAQVLGVWLPSPSSSPPISFMHSSSSSSRSTWDVSSTIRTSVSSTLSITSSQASTAPQVSSSSQPAFHPSTNAQSSSSSSLIHMPAIIAAIATSVAAVTLIALIVFLIYRRRHTRAAQRRKALSIAFPDSPFAWEREPGVQDDDKPWAPPGSGWPAPEELSLPVPVIPVPRPTTAERIRRPSSHSLGARGGPHYIVRSHASVGDVYGFGQDLAWQEAHYEDVVPLSSGAPIPISPLALRSSSIGIVPVPLPPTLRPSSGGAAATPLLRNTSHASSMSEASVYSRPSMAPSPSPSPPRHVPVLTRVEDATR
ncbi:hypothetical protein C8R46DRAFT_515420 [Mycena filopes]|nr:hypothetical protein C8R46DRAFT_515420 [Mycena filopes]